MSMLKKTNNFLKKNPYERKEENTPKPTSSVSNTTISELDKGTEINMDDMPF